MTPKQPDMNPSGSQPSTTGRSGERIRIVDDEGRPALMVDGAILSIALVGADPPSGYWAAMLPEGSPRSALLLGLGGGTLAHLLSGRYPGIEMVGIDADQEVIDFALRGFGLQMPNLEVVVGDAFDYVARCRRSFDFVAVDLFVGYSFQHGALARPFLRQLKSIAGSGGEIAFNLFKDKRTEQRLARIGRVLRVHRLDRAGRNLVAHCKGS
ncbi:MAG: methyltransferase domain-containing protein [Actinobacteria bacterium]|nr:methyltransferase domain-containing protein [Actinomycetota bacterium]